MTYLPWPWHSWQCRPATPLHSGQATTVPLPGGVTVAAMFTSLHPVHRPGCTIAVSGFSFAFGCAFEYRVGGRDRRLGRLDNGVAAPFGQDVPGFAEIDLVGFLGGNPDGPALVYLGLPLAVVLGDLGD